MSVLASRLYGLLLLLFAVLAALPALAGEVPLPSDVHLPINVHVSLRVLDITDLKETAGEMSASVEYVLRWTDPGRKFDPRAVGRNRQDFVADAATAELDRGWSPKVQIENQIRAPRSQSVALSVESDGSVRLIQRLDADFRVHVDLTPFPFDRQHLSLALVSPRYSSDDVVFIVDDGDRQLSTLSDDLSVNEWTPRSMVLSLERFYGWNSRPFQRLIATAAIDRIWMRYLLQIFVPFFAVVSVSLFLLWAPDEVQRDMAGITYSALLALAAISFTFESSYPGSMSVNSPIAFMISIGYFYLILTLVLKLAVKYAPYPGKTRYPYLDDEILANMKYTLPGIFFVICLSSVVAMLV
ncbi:neurotransmitter-gated ion-channel ligand-binding protein [Oryzibacter oryziterrae]|uniref:neurotransmitter-gated ion-channel ligand-binding protein n=1 Tax=Oryzibacter oryziterrae TaxID=2766474 RepID=UPI001F1AF749|nr:neurotransmitter-gated ion-channel ligand-binding protein [Oryzibacter oryziterrae]